MVKNGRLLNHVSKLKQKYVIRLNRLWLTTVEDVAGIIRLYEIDGNISKEMIVSLFADELEISFDKADTDIVQIIRDTVPDNEWYAIAGVEEALTYGLLIDEDEQFVMHHHSKISKTKGYEELPPFVDLLKQYPYRFRGISNQASRGTCVAFSVTALHEYIWSGILQKTCPKFSEEFLYWAARKKQYESKPATCHQCGTYIENALQAILDFGQCLSKTKPYQSNLPCNLQFTETDCIDNNFVCQTCEYGKNDAFLATGSLSSDCFNEADSFRLSGWKIVKLSTIEQIKMTLHKGSPVVIGVKVYLTWMSPTCRHSGCITLPFQREVDYSLYNLGAHAMLIRGYKNENAIPGGGYFIIRNSWGETWGDISPEDYSAGYGIIPYAYLARQPFQAYVIEQSKSKIL